MPLAAVLSEIPPQPVLPEAEIMAAMAGGERTAFAALHRAWGGRILALLLQSVSDRQTADAVLVEVFADLWRSAGDFDEDKDTVPAWLYACVRRTLIENGHALPSHWPIPANARKSFARHLAFL